MHSGTTASTAIFSNPVSPAVLAQPLGEAASLRAVVRGELPITNGMAARILAAGGTVERISLSVSAADLAEGIINLKDNHYALSEWASFVLVTSDVFDVDDEHICYWDRLSKCVWELAFGAPLRNTALSLANTVRAHLQYA